MKNQTVRQIANELQELYAQQDELKALIIERESIIKQEMIDREVQELNLGNMVIRFTEVISNRFNTTEFKKLHLNLYNAFLKEVTSKRFSIA